MAELETIGVRLKKAQGYTTGFDYLRIILAICVLLVHSAPITYGPAARWTFFPWYIIPFVQCLVPSFFSLSGFLVTASLLRTSIPSFIALRILRIAPALFVEVFVSALIIGPIATVLPLKDYFANGRLISYFHNLHGYIHYDLPGVFDKNPFPIAVNGSLWTVPFELECYIFLVLIGLLKLVKSGFRMVPVFAIATIYIAWENKYSGAAIMADGRLLVLYFAAGVTIYSLRDQLRLCFCYFLVSLMIAVYALNNAWAILIAPLPAAYCTAYLGLLRPEKNKIIASGDYSYGIYLYAFPIQQAVIYFSPTFMRIWSVNAALSLLIVGALAGFSWHAIEKPMLRLKKLLKRGHLDARDAQFAQLDQSADINRGVRRTG